MQLLFLYIGDIGRDIHDQSISFSDEYQVKYVKEEKRLQINRVNTYPKKIYGNNIIGIDLLVGQNGSGKSTILNLLGMKFDQRLNEFHMMDFHSWFALYHLEKNLFAIEGYDPSILSFLSDYDSENIILFAAMIKIEFKKGWAYKFTFLRKLLDVQRSKENALKAQYLFYNSRQNCPWYCNIVYPEMGMSSFFPRYHISDDIGNLSVLEYLKAALHEKKFQKIMETQPSEAVLRIYLVNPYKEIISSSEKEELSIIIYGNSISLISLADSDSGEDKSFSKQQCMVIRYLETLVISRYFESGKQLRFQGGYIEQEGTQEERYLHRKNYLLKCLKSVSYGNYKIYGNFLLYKQDIDLLEHFCEGIENINEIYFMSETYVAMYLNHYGNKDHYLDELMKALDENSDKRFNHRIDHRNYIKVDYLSLSSGEMDFINFYATLKNGLRKLDKSGTCILLLDEPDSYFHPEWSRRFIDSLTRILSSKPFRHFNYQIVAATHSPILLSDVPAHHIHCLSKDSDGEVKIIPSRYGFLNNINTIMLDSMFVRSSFGSFAEKYVNSILKKLSCMDKKKVTDENREEFLNVIREIENRMMIISEPVIREHLGRRIFFLREKVYGTSFSKKEKRIKELLNEIRKLEEGGD